MNNNHNDSLPIESLKVNDSILVDDNRLKDDNVLFIERPELNSRDRKSRK